MFNTGGAVELVEVHTASSDQKETPDAQFSSEMATSVNKKQSPTATIKLKVRGCGRFGAHLSQRPLKCSVSHAEVDFSYDSATGLVTLSLPVPKEEMYKWSLEIHV
uniref:Uncharacterized protein n=1 Tax=Rhizophora mucronata TaxID=61149 RepID=A0A2P2N131_RHIMU